MLKPFSNIYKTGTSRVSALSKVQKTLSLSDCKKRPIGFFENPVRCKKINILFGAIKKFNVPKKITKFETSRKPKWDPYQVFEVLDVDFV